MPIGPQPSVHRAVYPFHANLIAPPSAEGMKKTAALLQLSDFHWWEQADLNR